MNPNNLLAYENEEDGNFPIISKISISKRAKSKRYKNSSQEET